MLLSNFTVPPDSANNDVNVFKHSLMSESEHGVWAPSVSFPSL